MQYFKSFFSEPPGYDEGFEQFKKTPVLISVKDSKKKILSHTHLVPENQVDYDNEPNFAVYTGKVNNLLLVDFDTNKKINFNTSKLNGEEWFEKEFGKITDLFGLVTKTPSGGIHAYCLYTDDLPDNAIGLDYKIATKEDEEPIEMSVAIDILSNEGVGFQGRHYNLIQNKEIKEIPEKFLTFLKTLEYVPHTCSVDSYGAIYTLSSNNLVKPKDIPSLPNEIETSPLKIMFFSIDNQFDSEEKKRRPRMGLLLTDDYKEYLLGLDSIVVDYIFSKSATILGGYQSWSRDRISECICDSIVRHRSKIDNPKEECDIFKLKLQFDNNGFPMFKVFNDEGKPLDWIKYKHTDKPPSFDLSWTNNEVRVKAICEGIWIINKRVYCTFRASEIHLV